MVKIVLSIQFDNVVNKIVITIIDLIFHIKLKKEYQQQMQVQVFIIL